MGHQKWNSLIMNKKKLNQGNEDEIGDGKHVKESGKVEKREEENV